MKRAPMDAVGHIINALRGLEMVVGQAVMDNPVQLDRMRKVGFEIEEATRLIVSETQWPRLND